MEWSGHRPVVAVVSLAVLLAGIGCSSDGRDDAAAFDLAPWCEAAADLDRTFAEIVELGPDEVDRLIAVVDDAAAVVPAAIAGDVDAVASALADASDLLASGSAPSLSAADAPPVLLASSEENIRITDFNEANCAGVLADPAPPASLDPDQVIEVGPDDDGREAVAAALQDAFDLSFDEAQCVADNIDFTAAGSGGQVSPETLAEVFEACGAEAPTAPTG